MKALKAQHQPPDEHRTNGDELVNDFVDQMAASQLTLTLTFEVVCGRFVVGASWERIAADYRVLEGGLLPFGMLVLLLSALIAGRFRTS